MRIWSAAERFGFEKRSGVDVCESKNSTQAGEFDTGGAADATSCTSNEDDFVLKRERHVDLDVFVIGVVEY